MKSKNIKIYIALAALALFCITPFGLFIALGMNAINETVAINEMILSTILVGVICKWII